MLVKSPALVCGAFLWHILEIQSDDNIVRISSGVLGLESLPRVRRGTTLFEGVQVVTLSNVGISSGAA